MIRELKISELDLLVPLANEFYAASKFLGTFEFEKFQNVWTGLITSGLGAILFAEENGVALGAIGGLAHGGLYGGDAVAEEMFWFVTGQKRGAGVMLYRAFERWAKEKGAASIQMVHLMDSMPHKVAGFYRHLGFEQVEIRYSKSLK